MNTKKHEYLLDIMAEAKKAHRLQTKQKQLARLNKIWQNVKGLFVRWDIAEANSSDNSTIV